MRILLIIAKLMFSGLGNLDFFEPSQKYFCQMEYPEKALSMFWGYLDLWKFAIKFSWVEGHSILQPMYKIASNTCPILLCTGNIEPGPRKCIDCKKSYKSCDCKVTPL